MINIEGEQTQIRVGAWRPMFFLEVAKIYNVLGGAIATPKPPNTQIAIFPLQISSKRNSIKESMLSFQHNLLNGSMPLATY